MLVPVYPVPSATPSRQRPTQGGSPEHRQPPDDDGEPADDLVPLRPCREFCHRVEEQCPYFHPTTREQYAGEPVFICIDPNIPDLPSISNSSYGPPGNCYRPCHVNASLGPSDQCPAATLSTALLGPSPVPMGAANSAGRAGGRTSAPPGGPVLVPQGLSRNKGLCAPREQQQSAPCPDGPLAKGPHQRRGPAPPAWASGPATRRPPATQWPPPLKYRGERFYYNDGGTTLRVFRATEKARQPSLQQADDTAFVYLMRHGSPPAPTRSNPLIKALHRDFTVIRCESLREKDPNIPDLPSISNSSYGPPGNCYRPCHVNASLGPSDQCPAATLSTALLGPSPVPMGAANSAGRAGGRTSAPPGGPVLVPQGLSRNKGLCAPREQQQSAPCPDGPLAKGPHQRRGPAPPAWASGPATRRPPATQWPPPLKYRGERFYYNDGGTTLRVFRGGPIPVLPSRCRHLGRKPGRDGRKPRRPVPPPSAAGVRVCPTGDRTTLSTPS
ncbi:hypothetical protein ISCGN_018394 [Ixodes scapularis]